MLAGLLRRDPRRRLGAAEVERLLRRAVDSAQVTAPRNGHRTLAPTAPAIDLADPSDPPTAPVGRRRRPWLVAGVAGLTLAVGVGTAVLVTSRRDRPADQPVAAPPSAGAASPVAAPAFPCTRPVDGGDRVQAVPRSSGEAYALLSGWTWFADPAGFRIAAPVGWRYFKDGAVSCFQQPDGPRVLSVDPSVPPTPRPDEYWRAEERRLTAGGSLPGYAKVTIRAVPLYYQGAAEWECRWKNAKGVDVHT